MLSGSMVALVTPMRTSGSVDWGALNALIDWHLESGTHGIVPTGTTGESATLSAQEQNQVIGATVKRVDGRIPVVAGTGASSTSAAIELSLAGKDLGADACLIVTPYYNKPTQEGLYRHYCAIAEAVEMPIILYNVPPRTACDMQPITVGRLAEIECITGIKEACGDSERVKEILALVDDGFVVLSGEDAQTLTMMEYGATGAISVTANVVPKLMSEFCTAWSNGELERARALDQHLQPLHAALFSETSPIPTKWSLHQMGRIDSGSRLPLTPLSSEKHQLVRQALEAVGAL